MEMSEFINNGDTRGAVSKIISWVDEPKSSEIRSAAKSVVGSMFNLNPPELNSLLSALDKSLQVQFGVLLAQRDLCCFCITFASRLLFS